MKTILIILSALALTAISTRAADRFEALSQIESHDDDRAVGTQGEVSRYQILPEIWARAWALNERRNVTVRPTDPVAAKFAANWIMQGRCNAFEARYHRAPDDFEFYMLWHRPACYIGGFVPRPMTAVEADCARRFANLCQCR